MKKTLTVGLVVVLAVFLTVAVIYAFANKAKENPKSQTEKVTTTVPNTAIQESEKHPHAEGSAECIEKHAKGECTGHEPGQDHEGRNGQVGEDHAEGSAACQAKHASGECQAHQPGEKHSENNSKKSQE